VLSRIMMLLLLSNVMVVCSFANQLPYQDPPYTSKGVDVMGVGASGTADKETGQISATVNATNASGIAEAYVRWIYTYNGNESIQATVALKYSVTWGQLECHVDDPTAGAAMARATVGVRIRDASAGDTVIICVESKGQGQMMVPYNFGEGYRGQQEAVTFRPGHTYYLDAYVKAEGLVYGGEAADQFSPDPGGRAKASLSATIHSIALRTCAAPWIVTRIVSVYTPTRDTYDLYENALGAATGRNYFEAGAWIEVSAGGRYDRNQSQVNIKSYEAPIVRLKDCTLPYTVNENRDTATIRLPDCYSLPLEGKTWRFLLVTDPEYKTATSDVSLGPVFAQPIFACMAATSAQVPRQTLAAEKERASVRVEHVKGAIPAQYFFDARNWYFVVPARDWTGRGLREQEFCPPEHSVVRMPQINAGLYVPGNMPQPHIETPELNLKPVRDLKFSDPHDAISDEPVVIIRLLDLLLALCKVEGPQGYTLCYDNRFVRRLEQSMDDAEFWRDQIKHTYFCLPNGEMISLERLSEWNPPQRPITDINDIRDWDGEFKPVISGGAGMPLVAILMPRRALRWVRRAGALLTLSSLLKDLKPMQCGKTLTVQGIVRNTAGQSNDSYDSEHYDVVFDLIPRQQPWPLAQPMGEAIQ